MDRLHCAYCGKPLSAFEHVSHRNMALKRHVGWHNGCYSKDPAIDLPLSEALPVIEARGAGRVGTVADE